MLTIRYIKIEFNKRYSSGIFEIYQYNTYNNTICVNIVLTPARFDTSNNISNNRKRKYAILQCSFSRQMGWK